MTGDDEPLATLRAADPARDRGTDLTTLRAAVESRVDLPAAHDADPVLPRTGRRRDELAHRRALRSRRTAWVAGAAASVLVGLAGYAIGVGSSDRDAATDGSAGGAADEAPAQEQASVAAPNEVLEDDGAVTDTSAGGTDLLSYPAERAVFAASGLPDETGSAEAFGYDAAAVDGEAAAAEIAAQLGIDGSATGGDGAWTVTDADQRTLQVFDDGLASVSFYDPTRDPVSCADCATAAGDPLAIAGAFLDTIGVDRDTLSLATESTDGATTSVVGVPDGVVAVTGGQWYLSVAGGEVYAAWGALAPLTSLGEYATISAADAVDRLMDPRFGADGGVYPLAAAGSAAGSSADTPAGTSATDPTGAPAAVEPGGAIPWPVTSYTIDEAALVLSQHTLPDGAVVLLPAWSLTSSAAGSTWTVVAIQEDSLDLDAG